MYIYSIWIVDIHWLWSWSSKAGIWYSQRTSTTRRQIGYGISQQLEAATSYCTQRTCLVCDTMPIFHMHEFLPTPADDIQPIWLLCVSVCYCWERNLYKIVFVDSGINCEISYMVHWEPPEKRYSHMALCEPSHGYALVEFCSVIMVIALIVELSDIVFLQMSFFDGP